MPSRILKESICTSETLADLSWFEEVLFYRLIVLADDYGIFDARPKIIKGRAFPLDRVTEQQIEEALHTLATAGIVNLYTVGGRPYLQLESWAKHQQIRAKKSKYPQPIESEINCNQMKSNDCNSPRNPIQSESNPNPNPNADAETCACAQAAATEPKNDELAAVMNLYMDRVDSLPSEQCTVELVTFTKNLGAQVVCHAINAALDSNVRSWRYIRGILRDYVSNGVKTLDDVHRQEQQHEEAVRAKRDKAEGVKPWSAAAYKGNAEPSQVDLDKLKGLMDKM
jgi:DnaD/phage-associated family protein